ncbi:MAG: hypothetical protein ACKVRP_10275 [Bacteroidota bacterium]
MFPALLDTAVQKINTARKMLETSEEVRDFLANGVVTMPIHLAISQKAPATNDWKVFDHCATLTRLYAAYETFVEAIIGEVLALIPTMFAYNSLSEKFQTEHRNGISNVLQRMNTERLTSLSLEKVVHDYAEALAGVSPYVILPQALLRREQNMRLHILEQLFARVGIDGITGWIGDHALMWNSPHLMDSE